ncbi:MAG: tRNA 2-thiouridine(34) synthase MnmA [Solirubrobacteraceae bacterium]
MLRGAVISEATVDAAGCGTAIAAGSAAAALAEGRELLAAARLGAVEIAAALGGLSPAKQHAAELAADALHRALGAAARADAALAPRAGRTLVAMSGGVDSAVAATLCGADAVAVTLELWAHPENDAERSCCSAQAVRSARKLAHGMGLPHLSLDLREEFAAGVVEPWLQAHADGLTPNPCVRCNGAVRLEPMIELASRLGAEALATGHYARLQDGLLRVAADPAQDQSYMLAALPTRALRRLRFPLGELTKVQVRELAARHGLPVARKPDSQDLCFLAGTGKQAFLRRHGRPSRPGPIRDSRGTELARHDGQQNFTVGQRRGLGIGGGEPLYVLRKQGSAVIVGPREALRTQRVALRELTLHRPAELVDGVRLRYRATTHPCRLDGELQLLAPVARAAPGQLACLMQGELIVGHATIAA